MHLRPSGIILLIYFIYTATIAQLLPVRRSVANVILAVNILVLAGYIALARAESNLDPVVAVLLDWVPLALIILAYKEMGCFVPNRITYRLEERWIVWDRMFLNKCGVKAAIERLGPLFPSILEFSYSLVYVMPVLGLSALYVNHRSNESDRFLVQFVLSTLLAYALFPYFPSEPPRTVFPSDNPPVKTIFRRYNLWLLGQYGIHTSVFPSAHVSGAFGAAFATLRLLPDHTGVAWSFFVLACLITVATVYGRYHYFVDAIAGIGISVLALGIALALEYL
jgi:membrane-associated phospholipid phosphatase